MKLLCRHGDHAFLLMNVECTQPACMDYGRMFDKDQRQLPDINNTLSAAFFDITEDVSFIQGINCHVPAMFGRLILCKA